MFLALEMLADRTTEKAIAEPLGLVPAEMPDKRPHWNGQKRHQISRTKEKADSDGERGVSGAGEMENPGCGAG